MADNFWQSAVKKAKQVQSARQAPVGEAKAINDKTKMVQEYNDAVSAKPAAPAQPAAPAAPAASDKVNPAAQYGDRPGEARPGPDGLPQFKKGGRVKKTGLAKVHKKEVVLNPKQQKQLPKGSLAKALSKR